MAGRLCPACPTWKCCRLLEKNPSCIKPWRRIRISAGPVAVLSWRRRDERQAFQTIEPKKKNSHHFAGRSHLRVLDAHDVRSGWRRSGDKTRPSARQALSDPPPEVALVDVGRGSLGRYRPRRRLAGGIASVRHRPLPWPLGLPDAAQDGSATANPSPLGEEPVTPPVVEGGKAQLEVAQLRGTLKLDMPAGQSINLMVGEKKAFKVSVLRNNLEGPIKVWFANLPEGVEAQPLDLLNESEGQIELQANSKASPADDTPVKVNTRCGAGCSHLRRSPCGLSFRPRPTVESTEGRSAPSIASSSRSASTWMVSVEPSRCLMKFVSVEVQVRVRSRSPSRPCRTE